MNNTCRLLRLAQWKVSVNNVAAPIFTPNTPATRRAFNRLAREKMKLRLLADIRMDLMVCEIEGYSKLEYLDELLALVQELRKGGGEDGQKYDDLPTLWKSRQKR